MSKLQLVNNDTYYIGASDRRLALFENIYPLKNGVSYNSYLILDDKTCVLDSVDKSVEETFLNLLKQGLDGRELDYLIINHMEPDHSYSLMKVIEKYPNVTVVTNEKALKMFKNFNNDFVPKNLLLVKEGDTLSLGKHTLTFVNAPMVHWPEVMVTYDLYTKTLFSADAFGTFNALNGNIFADECDFINEHLEEARRYYTNIVGKYGPQVQALLKKASNIDIQMICPLHGPIWRQDLTYFIDKYDKWSSYTPEKKGVLIVYGSIYGNTEKVANIFASKLSDLGICDIKMYDASKTDKSYILSEAFKYSHLIILSSTYNMGIITPVEEFLLDLKYQKKQNRKYILVENGSRAPNSGKLMNEILSSMKNMVQIGKTLTINSALKDSQYNDIDLLVNELANDFPSKTVIDDMLYNISYGLYVLTTFDGKKNNGCILNSVNQVSSNPDRLMISINKKNYTANTLKETKVCNLCVLNKHTPFTLIKRFGFSSGKDVDKFEDFKDYQIAKNNLTYLIKYTNCYISLKVIETIDLGSHFGFILEIEEMKQISNEDSLTYKFYLDNLKPKPSREEKHIKGWRCKICGYIYEGENIPEDFICPLCKHGVKDFEKIGD